MLEREILRILGNQKTQRVLAIEIKVSLQTIFEYCFPLQCFCAQIINVQIIYLCTNSILYNTDGTTALEVTFISSFFILILKLDRQVE